MQRCTWCCRVGPRLCRHTTQAEEYGLVFLLPSFYSRESFTLDCCFSRERIIDSAAFLGFVFLSGVYLILHAKLAIGWIAAERDWWRCHPSCEHHHICYSICRATMLPHEDKILSSLFVSCSPFHSLVLFLSTPSMYHSAQLFVLKHICMWCLAVTYQETSEGKGWGSVLGKARQRPWNLANFIVICELCLVDLELELAKAQMQCCFHDLLLVAFKLCNVWTDEWWSALLDD